MNTLAIFSLSMLVVGCQPTALTIDSPPSCCQIGTGATLPTQVDNQHGQPTLLGAAVAFGACPKSARDHILVLHGSRFGSMSNLFTFAGDTDLIALARCSSVERTEFTPIGSSGPMQHTVFKMDSVEVLKGSMVKRSLLLRQNAGNLPYFKGSEIISGTRLSDEPLLEVGSRYLLFLKRLGDKAMKDGEPISSSFGGIGGIGGYAGEFVLPFGSESILQIQNGKFVAVTGDDGKRQPTKYFEDIKGTLEGYSVQKGAMTIKLALSRFEAVKRENRKKIEEQTKLKTSSSR